MKVSLNSTWLSCESHTIPSQHPMCLPGWILLCVAATTLLGFYLAALSPTSPAATPPTAPPRVISIQMDENEKHLPRRWQGAFCLVLQSFGRSQWDWGLPQGMFQLPYHLSIKVYFTVHPHGHALPCPGPSTSIQSRFNSFFNHIQTSGPKPAPMEVIWT